MQMMMQFTDGSDNRKLRPESWKQGSFHAFDSSKSPYLAWKTHLGLANLWGLAHLCIGMGLEA